MKTILIFSLICFTLSVWGPVDKIKNSNTEDVCDPLTATANSLSDCVDLNLKVTDEDTGKTHYADRCCFLRIQGNGNLLNLCYPLTEEQYLDITERIRQLEDECSSSLDEGKRCKIYQLDCSASNIKFLSFAILLLALLF